MYLDNTYLKGKGAQGDDLIHLVGGDKLVMFMCPIAFILKMLEQRMLIKHSAKDIYYGKQPFLLVSDCTTTF